MTRIVPEARATYEHQRYLRPERRADLRRRQLAKIGWTPEWYALVKAAQNGKCAICGGNNFDRDLAADHSHENNQPRGLLCSNCNQGLGRFHESIYRLENAIAYIRLFA